MKSVVILFTAVMWLPCLRPVAAQQSPPSVQKQIEEIERQEAAMMSAAAEKGAAGYLSFYAEDAVELSDGVAIIQGKTRLAEAMEFLNDKKNRLTWTPLHIDVAQSDDLAYSYGTFEFRSVGKDGKPVLEHGKYTTIWKKQTDGSWKVVLDMGNGSPN